MKNLFKVLAITIALFGITTISYAQTVSDDASATATIIAPIGIDKTVDMNFGNIAVGAVGGTVILDEANNRALGTPGSLVLPTSFPGTITSASFDITGNPGYTYAITVPSGNHIITNTTVPGETMIVNTFTSASLSEGIGAVGTLDINGEDIVTVGATLLVGDAQEPGVYTSTVNFNVTVGYN